jgi:hypothetical protein
VLLAGCVGAGIAPPKEQVARIKRAQIVAMEAHPLALPAEFSGLPAELPGLLAGSPVLPITIIAGILVEMPAASKRGGEKSKSLQAALEAKQTWVPTVVLASEVQEQLAAGGVNATLSPGVKPIPGVEDRSYTVFMENRMAPTRAWYNNTEPVSDYAALSSGQPTYVLEVAILNYEITGGKLLLQVNIKVIDPSNGHVIGRARAANPWRMPTVDPLDQAFADDGKIFKEVFANEGRKLVRECLTELGLIQ